MIFPGMRDHALSYPGMTGYVRIMPGRQISLAFSRRLLVEQRERAGLTQKGLADLCGLTRSQICRWETGENKPTAEALSVLVAGFKKRVDGFTVDDLIDARAA